MKATICYYNEGEYVQQGARLQFRVLTPVEKSIYLEAYRKGIARVSCSSGTIDEYAAIVAGCFEEDSNFAKMVARRICMEEDEIKQIDLEYSGQIIHCHKGVTSERIIEAYTRTSIFGTNNKEVTA